MQSLKDIKHNIAELRNRIKKCQDITINTSYLDNDNVLQASSLDVITFAKHFQDMENKRLHVVCKEMGKAYIISHQQSLVDLDNHLEMLMLEFGKIEVLIDTLGIKKPDNQGDIKQVSEKAQGGE